MSDMTNANATSNALQHTFTGAVLALLINFNNTWDKGHSLGFTLEECLIAGIEAKRRSKEYSEATQNRKKYEKELMADPTVVLRPTDMLRLMKKYGIGASNANLESQVIAAAEQMAKAAEAKEAEAKASETAA